jgi:ABC-type Zn uptake system ZnuABC Zn-binding protein ZnuA
MSDKLNIQNEMSVFDRKDRTFYDSLTDEERKKFSNFLMIRWGSSVQGSKELQEFYLIATNERFNKNFFAINRHPKLQWLAATTVSPDLGTHRHTWIAPKKKETGASAIRKQLAELFPHYKDDEIELMAKLNTKKDIDAYLKEMGREK